MNLVQYAKKWITPITLFVIAGLIWLHQFVEWKIIWEWNEALHHEVYIVALVFGGIVLYSVKRKLW